MASARIGDIRAQIANAEKSNGAARNAVLAKLVTDVEGSRSCDSAKIDMLKKSLQDLQALAM